MFSEALLQYLWEYLFFELGGLKDQEGRAIFIRKQGVLNRASGPDFLQAVIVIGEIEWHGNVEIHLTSEEWYRHRHHQDPAYNNVILHVVLHSGSKPILRQDGTPIPELSLADRIPSTVHALANQFQQAKTAIPCADLLKKERPPLWDSFLEKLIEERILQKAEGVRKRVEEEKKEWEQVLWEELAAYVGGWRNKEAFRELASSLPIQIIKKYADQSLQVRALLLGMGGYIEHESLPPEGQIPMEREWTFLAHKHTLEKPSIYFQQGGGMRPPNFPWVRLFQLSELVVFFPLFTQLIEAEGMALFLKTPFIAEVYGKRIALGKSQKEIVLMNALLPFAYYYGYIHGRVEGLSSLLPLVKSLSAEKNNPTKVFESLGYSPKNAAESQALIQLKTQYCDKKHCFACEVGKYWLLPKR